MTVPAVSMPGVNRVVALVRRPTGIPQAADFRLEERPLPPVGDGQFLIRNIYLSVDPAQRGWAGAVSNYADAVPLDSPMRALAVGVVVESRLEAVTAGDYYYGWFGWQDYCVAGAESILWRADPERAPLSAYAGILGINGLTAYLALMNLGEPRSGDTVLVSTAAGAVGSIVGQLAANLGCVTVGLTSSEEKAERCRRRFKYQHALIYTRADLSTALAAACPRGVDVYFDNAGGNILDVSLRSMAVRGRVVQCGTASIAAWSPAPQGLRNEREVLTKRLRWSGFVIFDHAAEFDAAGEALRHALADGKLVYEEDISHGITHAPGALQSIYAGENTGKKLIFIGA